MNYILTVLQATNLRTLNHKPHKKNCKIYCLPAFKEVR